MNQTSGRAGIPVRFKRLPCPQPGHFGRGPGLVDKDHALRIKVRLGFEPGFAPGRDVGPLLLAGV